MDQEMAEVPYLHALTKVVEHLVGDRFSAGGEFTEDLYPLGPVENFVGLLGSGSSRNVARSSNWVGISPAVPASSWWTRAFTVHARQYVPPMRRSTRPHQSQIPFRSSPEQGPQTSRPVSSTPTSGRISWQLAQAAGERRSCR